jgi:hypothetical protein
MEVDLPPGLRRPRAQLRAAFGRLGSEGPKLGEE